MGKPMETEWKILLIDPDPEIRKVMVSSLEVAGYIVVTERGTRVAAVSDGSTGDRSHGYRRAGH